MYELKQFSDLEQLIIKAFEKDEFKNNGVRETCRRLSKKSEHSPSTIKNSYVYMNKYGLFEHIFPERFKDIYVPFATRLKTTNKEKLAQLSKSKGLSKQDVVNKLIEDAI